MSGIYIIIGGNLGNREQYLRQARALIDSNIGLILKKSQIYETGAWGKEDVPSYLNQVLQLETVFTSMELLSKCLEIEKEMGRERKEKWSSRIIDIDLLLFNSEIIHDHHLIIPHPHMCERRFVLMPLAEIAPNFKHPIILKNMITLLNQCKDHLSVKIYKV